MKKTTPLIALLALTLPALRAGQPAPAGLSAGDWADIRAAHEDWRHRFEKTEDGGHTASNPGQAWTTRFDGRGFLVEPSGESWRWGLELRTYGVGESRVTLAEKAPVAVSGETLSYRWDGHLEEWFLNDTRGIEQGWTFRERPAGSEQDRLTLELAVRGGLEPQVNASGLGVSFADESGIALTYGGLKAWDATGRDLAVRFVQSGAGHIAIEVDERNAVYPVTIDPIAQQARMKADNAGNNDVFGTSVAVSGNTVVVGASQEAGPGDVLANSGAAYVFVRDGNTWTQQGYLRAPNAGMDDYFGGAVAISGDVVAVGARGEDATAAGDPSNNALTNSGAAYVFTRSGSTWSFQSRLKAPNAGEQDFFGVAVALSADFLVVSATGEDNDSGSVQSDNNNGFNEGAVYVFEPSGMSWTLEGYLKASTTSDADGFGTALALSGNTLAVGATSDALKGSCAVFVHNGTSWSEQAVLNGSETLANDLFGNSVAISGDVLVVGAPADDVNQLGTITSVDDESGAAYVFTRTAGVWTERAVLRGFNREPKDEFGTRVAVSGNFVAVGALYEGSDLNGSRTPGVTKSGAVYLYHRSGSDWPLKRLLKGGSNMAFGLFGNAVAMDGATLISGANGEDNFAGAVYAFTITEVAPTLSITGKKTVRVDAATASYTVRGTAADADGNLARVEAKDSRPKGKKGFRSAKGTAAWTYRAPLKPGRNKIQIVAVDAAGNRSLPSQVTVIRK